NVGCGDETARLYDEAAIAVDRDHAAFGKRERDADGKRQAQPHVEAVETWPLAAQCRPHARVRSQIGDREGLAVDEIGEQFNASRVFHQSTSPVRSSTAGMSEVRHMKCASRIVRLSVRRSPTIWYGIRSACRKGSPTWRNTWSFEPEIPERSPKSPRYEARMNTGIPYCGPMCVNASPPFNKPAIPVTNTARRPAIAAPAVSATPPSSEATVTH